MVWSGRWRNQCNLPGVGDGESRLLLEDWWNAIADEDADPSSV